MHTKEPWHVRTLDGSFGGIDSAEDYSVAQTHQRPNDALHLERIANARRIVACVNACVGISTDQLERINLFEQNSKAWAAATKATEQRDELLAALKSARRALASASANNSFYSGAYEDVDEAIKKADLHNEVS